MFAIPKCLTHIQTHNDVSNTTKLYYVYYCTRVTASVVQWSGFLATDTEISGSIPGATRFSEWQWVWKGALSLVSLVRSIEELLE